MRASDFEKQDPREKIQWIMPNFDWEWQELEAQRQMPGIGEWIQKNFPTKDAWLELAPRMGKSVVINPRDNIKIQNAYHDRKDFARDVAQNQDYMKHASAAFADRRVRMPIVVKLPTGMWLLGGNRRLGIAHLIKQQPATVWMMA